MARLVRGRADKFLQHYLNHIINLHGISKGRPRPILHVLLGHSPLQIRTTMGPVLVIKVVRPTIRLNFSCILFFEYQGSTLNLAHARADPCDVNNKK